MEQPTFAGITDDQQAQIEWLMNAAMEYGWEQGKRDTPAKPDMLWDWSTGWPLPVTDLVVCCDRI
jgi:hypothetical protein